ncbi:AGL078Wp [Eremothecium gossypii ATCC 10895]|uniref:AGL078Wp n=1 Tax=Eremothecium gossypii (strain ATCC 10895 / CBS 109.51 / FGSC 9923 / NRRL Y-1056) TaxID=284811 RepID=Q751A2_EREGS|nr:AGL078Wp [Eremothecium gossypii ATCC 10895]AAS54412.1 AGL078Wp [Eremothecium gossypii ATCC 10895]AEY98740.1 FAGL078Wp [Eremothecium gossypii FDAG1]
MAQDPAMVSGNDAAAFRTLKPFCVALSKLAFLPQQSFDGDSIELATSLEALRLQLQKCRETHKVVSPKIADYVFVPISSLLKQDSLCERSTGAVLGVIGELVKLCWSEAGTLPLPLAQQLLTLCAFLASPERGNSPILAKPGDFKWIAVDTLGALLQAIAVQKTAGVYDFNVTTHSSPALGHAVTILLDVLLHEVEDSALELRVVEILGMLYRDMIGDGEVLSYILPGNVSTFTKLLLKPGLTVNYMVVCALLDLFADLLCLVYGDASLGLSLRPIGSLQDALESGKRGAPGDAHGAITWPADRQGPHRNESWLRGTSGQLKKALGGLIPKLLMRSNQKINEHLNRFAQTVLKTCGDSLLQCQDELIKALLGTDDGGDPTLDLVRFRPTLTSLLEKDTEKLGEMIRLGSINELRIMKNLLAALGLVQNLESGFLTHVLTKLHSELYLHLQLEVPSIKNTKVLEQSGRLIVTSFDLESEDCYVRQLLRYIGKDTENAIEALVRGIGARCKTETLDDIVGWLLSSHSEPLPSALAIWLSSQLLQGYILQPSVKDQCEEYLVFDEDSDNTPLNCTYALLEQCTQLLTTSTTSISEVTKGTLSGADEMTALLCLDGFRTAIKVMQEDFRDELIEYLYPLVDSLASSSQDIRSMAQLAILELSGVLYGGSVRTLLLDNTDYMIDCISLRLENCVTDRVATILGVLCKIVGFEIVEQFQDVINQIFRMLDYYHGYQDLTLEFFLLFEVIVEEIRNKYMSQKTDLLLPSSTHASRSNFQPWGNTNLDQMLLLLTPQKESAVDSPEDPSHDHFSASQFFKDRLEADSDDEVDETDDAQAEPQADIWESPIPREPYRILLQFINYCDRLLTHPSKHVRIQILRLLQKLIPMLATQYNTMLPKIARVWDLLVDLATGSDPALLKETFAVLTLAVSHSGDFLNKRFIDFWAKLRLESSLFGQQRARKMHQFLSKPPLDLQHTSSPLREAQLSLCSLLVAGIANCELLLSEKKLADMLSFIKACNATDHLILQHKLSMHCIDILYSFSA